MQRSNIEIETMLFPMILLQLFGVIYLQPIHRKRNLWYSPSNERFCDLSCQDQYFPEIKVPNIGCRCIVAPKCTNYLTTHVQMVSFRTRMLQVHNKFREKVASGKEAREHMGPASNMNILNYDLSLEYLALCQALTCSWGASKCSKTRYFPHIYQSIAGMYTFKEDEVLHESNISTFERTIWKWYNKIIHVNPSFVDNYTEFDDSLPPNVTLKELSAILTGTVTHLGCAITVSYKDDNIKLSKLLCNYGGGGNRTNRPVYLRGTACSQCPYNQSCNEPKYPSLCGELLEMPTAMVKSPNTASSLHAPTYAIIILVLAYELINK